MANDPKLLLMDEPLASLDAARKAEIMPYLERLRDEVKIPIVYVSHSVAEVMRLASDVAVLAQGKLAAFGPAAEIAQRQDLVPAEEAEEGGVIIDMQVAEIDLGLLHIGIGQRRGGEKQQGDEGMTCFHDACPMSFSISTNHGV